MRSILSGHDWPCFDPWCGTLGSISPSVVCLPHCACNRYGKHDLSCTPGTLVSILPVSVSLLLTVSCTGLPISYIPGFFRWLSQCSGMISIWILGMKWVTLSRRTLRGGCFRTGAMRRELSGACLSRDHFASLTTKFCSSRERQVHYRSYRGMQFPGKFDEGCP